MIFFLLCLTGVKTCKAIVFRTTKREHFTIIKISLKFKYLITRFSRLLWLCLKNNSDLEADLNKNDLHIGNVFESSFKDGGVGYTRFEIYKFSLNMVLLVEDKYSAIKITLVCYCIYSAVRRGFPLSHSTSTMCGM